MSLHNGQVRRENRQNGHAPVAESQNGNAAALGHVIENHIAAYEHAEHILYEQVAVYRSMIDNFPNGAMILFDRDLRYLVAGGAELGAVGLDKETMEGRTIWEIFSPEMCAQIEPQYRATLAGAQSSAEVVYKDHVYMTHTLPVRDAEGTIIAGVLVTQDITAQKEAERLLRRANERAENILESVSDAFFALDKDWCFTYINGHAERLLQHSREELLGKKVWETFPEAVGSTFYYQYNQAVDTNTPVRFEEYYAPLGIWAEVVAAPSPEGLSVYFRDISERKRAEQERQELQEQIIDTQKAMLRELSTPLIPLDERVVAMPLIGSVDTQRAQQVMETLLEGIQQHQAEIAILDITGVPTVDTQVANALMRAAQAVRLLGANVVLTGIRPDIAQTLVQLGVNLGDIVTRSTLQAGIAYATRKR
jgi:rsbT co-antagonist protein RsbR